MEEIGGFNPEKEAFFADLEAQHLAVTYDDVRLRTRSGRDTPLPEEIDLSSRFSRNVPLRIPFVSAAMNSVTESNMAIAMAEQGGLGVIHAAMTIEDQYNEVQRVKKHVNTRIDKPISVLPDQTLESVLKTRAHKGYDFMTFPVVDTLEPDADRQLLGILTSNDFKYPESMQTTVGEAMTSLDKITSAGAGTTSEEAYRRMQEGKIPTLPLTEAGVLRGLYLWSDVSRVHRESHRYNVDDEGRLLVVAAVPTRGDYLERVGELQKYADAIVLDSADGDSFYIFEALEKIKSEYDIDVVAGNISEGISAYDLADAGADGVKGGQGPGSICTTRPEIGIGKPQVSAVYEIAKALRNRFPDVPICADGGIKDRGDISVAVAAGAHNVMMGRMLSGTKEAPGLVYKRRDGSQYKEYWGMGSAKALRESAAARERYGGGALIVPEGIEARVPYEGELKDVLGLCVAALAKSMRYVKAPDIATHREQTLLMRITGSGLRENHPHDVEVVTQ